MTPTREELEKADCWFASDAVGGPDMTAFKREARWRQHRWAVEELGITQFDSHLGRQTKVDIPPRRITNGTKLLPVDAEGGSNFLTPAIHEVARGRVANHQEHQTLDTLRLLRDLLSSMPMAFNLFGEASLREKEAARQALAEIFAVPTNSPSEIVFEWSPARRSGSYTRDRTAFDVALLLGADEAPRTVVGIETKYHEHPIKEKTPNELKTDAYRRFTEQTDFLIAIAESSGAFLPGWEDRVLNTSLRQIWRDHLLALSMSRHQTQWTLQTKYVLLFPRRNVGFSNAAQAYSEVLVPQDASFLALTIEDVVEAAFVHSDSIKERFRRRYLW